MRRAGRVFSDLNEECPGKIFTTKHTEYTKVRTEERRGNHYAQSFARATARCQVD